MKFLKSGETDLDSIRKICGEIVNIESGRILYKEGTLVSTEGQPIHYDTPDTKYSFYHNSGVVYVPPQWSHGEMAEFAQVLFETLEKEYPDEHLEKSVVIENDVHTTTSVIMQPKRYYYVAENEGVKDHKGFVWVLRPFSDIGLGSTEKSADINAVIEMFGSIVFDKYDVFDIPNDTVVADPGIHNLRVYSHIQTTGLTRISDFEHTDYFFPFLDRKSTRENASLRNFSGNRQFKFVRFPTDKLNASSRGANYCSYCAHLTFGRVYLEEDRVGYNLICPTCVHHDDSIDNINVSHVCEVPTTLEEYMESLNVPEKSRDVYVEARKSITKIKLDDHIQPGQKIYQIGTKYIGVDDAGFDKFIYSRRAIEAAKLGKIVNVSVVVVA